MRIAQQPRQSSRFCDLTGRRYGNIVVVEDPQGQCSPNPRITIKCDCGEEAQAVKHAVKRGGVLYCTWKCALRQPPIPVKSRLYQCHRKYIRLHKVVARWVNFRDMLRDIGDETLWIGPRDKRKFLGPHNYITYSGQCAGTVVDVGGDARTLTGWAKLLGISKQRTTVLYHKGQLPKRVRARKREMENTLFYQNGEWQPKSRDEINNDVWADMCSQDRIATHRAMKLKEVNA